MLFKMFNDLFTDEHRLSDYAIGPEAKLNLVVRPAGEKVGGPALASSSRNPPGGVWQTLSTVLAKHFSPADAAKVQEQLIKVCLMTREVHSEPLTPHSKSK